MRERKTLARLTAHAGSHGNDEAWLSMAHDAGFKVERFKVASGKPTFVYVVTNRETDECRSLVIHHPESDVPDEFYGYHWVPRARRRWWHRLLDWRGANHRYDLPESESPRA